ncbi:MAG: peptidoglycan editing factor PgeF [Firmicutes bacterium HGW-Firmicutes-7]|nr:MAG: peptidoglycan editing factor PgeF [Firmicutes bacterium HGW-Firmicutes-7]
MLSSEYFSIQQKDKIVYIQMPILSATGLVNHCFSTRLGGVSSGSFESMNLGFDRGDKEENVRENYRLICDAIDINTDDLVFSSQVHEDKIVIVEKSDRGKGFTKENDLVGVDGLITNEKNVALVTSYADCVPLFFLDPVNKVIALTHAGWRGTVKKIGAKTVQMMGAHFGSKPEELLIAIGPSIGACCFEVSEDVKIEVEKMFNHDIIDKIVKKHQKNKYMVDLWTANEEVLLEVGIKKEHIQKTDICTMCHKEVLFSHRGTDGKRGSMVAIMALK